MPSSQLAVSETVIPGLYEIDLVVHGDERGWFKESYQREKLVSLGLPSFEIVQNNVSYNEQVGVTRGLHAEPWEKYISIVHGRAFGAWVDLRPGPAYGQTYTLELTPGNAVFVPRGVANGYQTLEDRVVYSYLVNAHWSADATYRAVDLWDPALGIRWPIGAERAIVSEKDQRNLRFADAEPMVL
jgi:dTDP-4-dehydrorhamnose 3,5-epimerase